MTTSPPPTDHGPFGLVVAVPATTAEAPFNANLREILLATVPLAIRQQPDLGRAEMMRTAQKFARQIGSHGDDLQFGGRHRGATLSALISGFALLSRAEGGVTALGVHACRAPHEGCPGAH
ncbi:hypothetical protein BIV57_13310 [Mangrovactinospora gilvigrisea]|uniref:Uncharacterized protein n=1 Tax=Mangrovactinospora gilvigrisea TaxID=1428644 RepID=A0A1J7BEA7_9ACTN|nr:hypothetical protein [Mangrovactinospora gilvigrisea]OIV36966.1 hypothetical protein BIV57_13310 [Mangrovactinospora gilvigrisea]